MASVGGMRLLLGGRSQTAVLNKIRICAVRLVAKTLGIFLPEDSTNPAMTEPLSRMLPWLVLPSEEGPIKGANPITRVLADMKPEDELYGQSFQDKGEVDSWLEWMSQELEGAFVAMLTSAPPGADARKDVMAALNILDRHLERKTKKITNGEAAYLAGKKLSVADITLAAYFQIANDARLLQEHSNIVKWVATVQREIPHLAIPATHLKKASAPPTATPETPSREAKVPGGGAAAEAQTENSSAAARPAHDPSPLGITAKKSENFSDWYTQVITRSEMIEYYDISGCYILRPRSFFIWEQIKDWLDVRFKTLGVRNSYFPLFVSKSSLETEKDHVEGFSPEVAWVTKTGRSDLAQPIAIRPTSETIMYPAYAKWLRSHRDLPLKLNQWTSVVRWEFKQPTPFIRTREFLWQEGHTAHLTRDDAKKMVFDILGLYEGVYKELLAVPVMKGIKSENEKFAGGDMTTTVEAFIPSNGRAIQAGTSHLLGQNFAKMFGIEVEDDDKQKRHVEQTSWGLSTRSIGAMIMTHGDDKGLVLPPRVALIQVVLIPITIKKEDRPRVTKSCEEIEKLLKEKAVRTHIDDRENYNPGWKYNHWEVRGVPLRLEVGPRDVQKGTCRLVRRDNKEKQDIEADAVGKVVPALLDTIHEDMYVRALKNSFESNVVTITEWKDVLPALNTRKLILAPWCETMESEEEIKQATKTEEVVETEDGAAPALSGSMKALCIPLDQPDMPPNTKCFFTGAHAKRWALFGRSY